MKQWIVNASIFVLCMVVGVWVFANRSLPKWPMFYDLKASKPITYTLKKSSFTIEAPAFGELQAASSTAISVPQVRTGGLKVFWIVKDGSMVKKGDTLVEFDASELIKAGLNPECLTKMPSLGGMEPGRWYFLPLGTVDTHHNHMMSAATIAMAVDVR